VWRTLKRGSHCKCVVCCIVMVVMMVVRADNAGGRYSGVLLFLSHLRALPSLQELTSFVDSRRVGIRVACDNQGDHPAVISAALQHAPRAAPTHRANYFPAPHSPAPPRTPGGGVR
jgi:hypothetical protein